MALKDLDKGDKVDVHVALGGKKLAIIDRLRAQYNCSRAAIIEAWADEFESTDLTGKVKAGRRPGGGRKKAPRKDPMEEFYVIVPELKQKI